MGAFFETIPDSLIKWILAQKVFWVSTAPLSANGHVNVSPKGGEGGQFFGIPDTRTFWYQDLTGSGNETISHLVEPSNGRITVLFNAFQGPARIMRLWGKGRVLENGTQEFADMVERENITCIPGTRSIIVVDIHQVGTSCGFSVPFYDFKEYRTTLNEFFEKKEKKFLEGNEKESMDRYWALKNAWSMDGLPGMQRGLVAGKKYSVEPLKKMVGPLAPKNGGHATKAELHASYMVIAFLTLLVALLAATHPAFQFIPAQKRMQDIMLQAVTSVPGGSPSSVGLPD
ncbi:Uu.00g118450.m01.CDS01 [Anthostomella pinea]|uniref:Uu.00g118450.m01.CDS01 n=1 Tax=Anthostomella pinea TaxID=933095 RepID=A0AAI8VH48_9PEZI|nr:Uu.00g118450.m01.CDS01 [Anthostomella pinea]